MKTITLPLNDYMELIETKKHFNELSKNKTIFIGYGFQESSKIITQDEALILLKEVIEKLKEAERELVNENRNLRYRLFDANSIIYDLKKSWFRRLKEFFKLY